MSIDKSLEVRERRQRHWFWLDKDVVDLMGPALGGKAILVYALLCRHADLDQKSWPSQSMLAKKCGISDSSVRRTLRLLEKHMVIKTERASEKGRLAWNIYFILSEECWDLPSVTVTDREPAYPQGFPPVSVTDRTIGQIEPPRSVKSNADDRSGRPVNKITTEQDNNRTIPPVGGSLPSKPHLTAPTKHQQVVTHIMESYKQKFKVKYPLSGRDGSAVKRLVGIYGVEDLIALWDEFLERDWTWYDPGNLKVVPPRDLAVFQKKLTFLLEEGKYKSRVRIPPADRNEGMASIHEIAGSVLDTISGSRQ